MKTAIYQHLGDPSGHTSPPEECVDCTLVTPVKSREQVLRLIALEAIWEWVSRSHANFPEHDHHCPCRSAKETDGCTCGYGGALTAMKVLDTLERT